MKLKEVYTPEFLKSFGKNADKVGEIELNGLSIDPYAIARAMDYEIKPIDQRTEGQIPEKVIYDAHFYKEASANVFIAGQIAQNLWGEKPFEQIYVFNPKEGALHLFVENMLMPESLLSGIIRTYLQENGGVNAIKSQTGGQLLLLEICNQLKIPMPLALNRLSELQLIHLDGPIL